MKIPCALKLKKHQWKAAGWSYVRCETCDKSTYNPKLNSVLMNEMISKMPWNEEDKSKFALRGALRRGL